MVWTNWLKSSSNWCFFWLQMPYKNSKNCSQRCGPYAKRNGTLESGKHLSVTESELTNEVDSTKLSFAFDIQSENAINYRPRQQFQADLNCQYWFVFFFFFFLIFSHVWNEKNRMLTILGNKCWMLGQLLDELDCLLNFCTGLQVLRKM